MKNKQTLVSESTLNRVQNYIEREIFPGCEFALINNGKIEKHLFGDASILPKREVLRAGEHWDLASVTKVVATGTLVINRVLDGRLELDKTFKSYYPNWWEDSLTLRQLLTHTSGINPFIENRDQLNAEELIKAIINLPLSKEKKFRYTDINFILLGLMLEYQEKKSLAELAQLEIFLPWQMLDTSYGPVANAIPTAYQQAAGLVHDPKAKILGPHCGSAGLFSTLDDLIKFVEAYFLEPKYLKLLNNYTGLPQEIEEKRRSLAWDLYSDEWLLHTGYTGTFILINLKAKQAVIFLSNRVHLKDERPQWILDRNLLINDFVKDLEKIKN